LHAIVEGERQDMPRALPQRETATYFGAISQLKLKDIGKQHF
jgi:hypothetical protein